MKNTLNSHKGHTIRAHYKRHPSRNTAGAPFEGHTVTHKSASLGPAGQLRQSPASPQSRKQKLCPWTGPPNQAKQCTKGRPRKPKEDLETPGEAHGDPEGPPGTAMRTSEFLPSRESVQNMCTHSVNIRTYSKTAWVPARLDAATHHAQT